MSFRVPVTFDCTNPRYDLLAGFPYLRTLKSAPTFCALLDNLDGWYLLGADLDAAPYRIDAHAHTIRLNTRGLSSSSIMRSQYFRCTVMLAAISAVRAAWAAQRETEVRNLHRPDLWPLIGRITRADTAVLTARMAFELLHEGEDHLWRHMLGDSLSDVALEYARVLEANIIAADDSDALAAAMRAWFDVPERLHVSDAQILAEMDLGLPALAWDGRGKLSEGAVRCLSVDPLNGQSYLGTHAGDLAANPAFGDIVDPINQAHFLQVMEEIGTVRVGGINMRDGALARRLFPDLLEA